MQCQLNLVLRLLDIRQQELQQRLFLRHLKVVIFTLCIRAVSHLFAKVLKSERTTNDSPTFFVSIEKPTKN